MRVSTVAAAVMALACTTEALPIPAALDVPAITNLVTEIENLANGFKLPNFSKKPVLLNTDYLTDGGLDKREPFILPPEGWKPSKKPVLLNTDVFAGLDLDGISLKKREAESEFKLPPDWKPSKKPVLLNTDVFAGLDLGGIVLKARDALKLGWNWVKPSEDPILVDTDYLGDLGTTVLKRDGKAGSASDDDWRSTLPPPSFKPVLVNFDWSNFDWASLGLKRRSE